jgi:hypothetical protein
MIADTFSSSTSATHHHAILIINASTGVSVLEEKSRDSLLEG